jgi:hypothetical protein
MRTMKTDNTKMGLERKEGTDIALLCIFFCDIENEAGFHQFALTIDLGTLFGLLHEKKGDAGTERSGEGEDRNDETGERSKEKKKK